MQSIGSVMLLGYNAILVASPTAVAVLGVYFKLQSFIFMPVFGLNQEPCRLWDIISSQEQKKADAGLQEFTDYSNRNHDHWYDSFSGFSRRLLKMFSADAQMMEMGACSKNHQHLFYSGRFWNYDIYPVSRTGHGVYSLMGSLIRQLIEFAASIYYLSYGWNYSILGIFPLAEIIGLIYSAVMLKRCYTKRNKRPCSHSSRSLSESCFTRS